MAKGHVSQFDWRIVLWPLKFSSRVRASQSRLNKGIIAVSQYFFPNLTAIQSKGALGDISIERKPVTIWEARHLLDVKVHQNHLT